MTVIATQVFSSRARLDSYNLKLQLNLSSARMCRAGSGGLVANVQLIKSSDGILSFSSIIMCGHCWFGLPWRTWRNRFVMPYWDGADYGLLQIEVGRCFSWKDPGSEESQLERSQGLKGDLSLGCCFLHLHNSLLRHIPASFINAAPDCRIVPTPAGSMQWRLWLKGCQRNMTRSLFPSPQPWFIDCHWFNTRATPSLLAFCHKSS